MLLRMIRIASSSVVGQPDTVKEGMAFWLCITAFQLIYSMITTSFALTVLPREAENLNVAACWHKGLR